LRLGVLADNLLEWLALHLGLVPVPFLQTLHAVGLGRVLMGATRLGIFEALAKGPLPAAEVARACGLTEDGARRVLEVLASSGYLRRRGELYALTRLSRRWLLRDSPVSLHDSMLFRYLEWEYIERAEDYVRTGSPVRMHEEMTPEGWELYQRGMRSLARLSAPEVARKVPVPKHPRRMLDVGGAHGLLSVALCRRYPGLRAEVLDLPEAVEASRPLLAQEGMGDRVVHLVGDARHQDLGEGLYDLVLVANLIHHFDEPTNRDLCLRIARALRPGGYLAVVDTFGTGARRGQLEALADLYFASTSLSGAWPLESVTTWQRDAGLAPQRYRRLVTMPGFGIQAASKPR